MPMQGFQSAELSMQTVFSGRSRVNRLNLADDHAVSREQTLQQAKEARELRERATKERKAKLIILRMLRKYVTVRRLHKIAVAFLHKRTLSPLGQLPDDTKTPLLSDSSMGHVLVVASALRWSLALRVDAAERGGPRLPAALGVIVLDLRRRMTVRAGVSGVCPEMTASALDGMRLVLTHALRILTDASVVNAALEVVQHAACTQTETDSWLLLLNEVAEQLPLTALANVDSIRVRILPHLKRVSDRTVQFLLTWRPATPLLTAVTDGHWQNRVVHQLISRSTEHSARSVEGEGEGFLNADETATLQRALDLVIGAETSSPQQSTIALSTSVQSLLSFGSMLLCSHEELWKGSTLQYFTALYTKMDEFLSRVVVCVDESPSHVTETARMIDGILYATLGYGSTSCLLLWKRTALRFTSSVSGEGHEELRVISAVLQLPFRMVNALGSTLSVSIPYLSRLTNDSDMMRLCLSTTFPMSTGSSGAPWWLDATQQRLTTKACGLVMLCVDLMGYALDSGAVSYALRNAGGKLHEAGELSPFDEAGVRHIVRALRDMIIRAHLYGCGTVDDEIMSTRACALLSKLFMLDEVIGFASSSDFTSTASVITGMDAAAQWSASLRDDENESDALESAADTAARRTWLLRQSRRNVFDGSQTWPVQKRLASLLRNAPFVVPFPQRVSMFGAVLQSNRNAAYSAGMSFNRDEFVVRRGMVFLDAFTHFAGNFGALRGRLAPRFQNEAGFGDGVYRDFIQCVCKEGFDPQCGLFAKTDKGLLFPNPASGTLLESHLQMFQFLGCMVGKALADGILLDLPLSPHFRNSLLGRRNGLDHLERFDPDVHHSLIKLRTMRSDEISSLMLTFSKSTDVLGEHHVVDLVPNGQSIDVTSANVGSYVLHYADYLLNRQNRQQTVAFQAGLHSIIESTALQIFGSQELDVLFQGSENEVGLDVTDWQQNTKIVPEEAVVDPVINFFWEAVRRMSPENQRKLLAFVTSTRRAPLLGFRHMVPPFTIVLLSEGTERLPSAATCFCQLKLPRYRTLEDLISKLGAAIEHGQTFELS